MNNMPRGRPRKNLDLNLASIREMRTREEKLRAIFTDELKPIPEENEGYKSLFVEKLSTT